MLTSRSFGGSSVTSLPPIRTRPEVGVSSPAIMRKRRGLAAARRAEQRHQRAGLDIKRDAIDRGNGLPNALVTLIKFHGRRPAGNASCNTLHEPPMAGCRGWSARCSPTPKLDERRSPPA